jgi:hypothetical protein
MSKKLDPHDPKKRTEALEKKTQLYEKIDQELIHGVNLYRFIVENSHIGSFRCRKLNQVFGSHNSGFPRLYF